MTGANCCCMRKFSLDREMERNGLHVMYNFSFTYLDYPCSSSSKLIDFIYGFLCWLRLVGWSIRLVTLHGKAWLVDVFLLTSLCVVVLLSGSSFPAPKNENPQKVKVQAGEAPARFGNAVFFRTTKRNIREVNDRLALV